MDGLIRDKLKENGIEARVESRIKRLFSIWQKLQRQSISVDQTYDLFAIRIITSSVNDCYAVLGIIHNQWRPVPGRIKDFIAMPRPNLYQSLHTTVIAENGNAFEVQIRTEEMHQHGGRRHRRALEIQRRPDLRTRRTASRLAASTGRVAARHSRIPTNSFPR